jgi:hypothetical protein
MKGERPCTCDRSRHGPYSEDQCRRCWLWLNDPDYRVHWGGEPLPVAVPVASARQRWRKCIHRGDIIESKPGCGSCSVYACALHTRCMVGRHLDHPDLTNCLECNDHSTGLEWISTADLVRDAITLAGLLPPGVSGIAGIPRSGLIPAAVIATHLQLPLWELNDAGYLRRLGHGSRGRHLGFAGGTDGQLAVVDDTVYSGGAMRRVRQALQGRPAVFTAIYVRPEERATVDLFGRLLAGPHLLEWNLFNNGPFVGSGPAVFRDGVATDLDGVLCHDAASGGKIGTPYLLPRRQVCKLIATGRRERDRAGTEAWLRQWGVSWGRLEMYPDAAPAGGEATHKARHFAESGCGFFVESDTGQAEAIFRLAGKPVICPAARRVWQ